MASSDRITITETGSKTYIINPKSDKHVYISHGSAGPGLTEELVAQTLLDKGINVTIFNYFKKHGIDKLFWWDHPSFIDQHEEVSLLDLANVDFHYGNIKFHIGFSLGGYLGLVHSNQFTQNFCFYPGCLPLPKKMKLFDYSNTKIYIGSNDNWCLDSLNQFLANIKSAPEIIYLDDCYHSFMSIDKMLETEVLKFTTNEQFVDNDTLHSIKFHTEKLKNLYKWERISVTLKYNKDAYDKCLEQIVQSILSNGKKGD
jgi:hypothetical protein